MIIAFLTFYSSAFFVLFEPIKALLRRNSEIPQFDDDGQIIFSSNNLVSKRVEIPQRTVLMVQIKIHNVITIIIIVIIISNFVDF